MTELPSTRRLAGALAGTLLALGLVGVLLAGGGDSSRQVADVAPPAPGSAPSPVETAPAAGEPFGTDPEPPAGVSPPAPPGTRTAPSPAGPPSRQPVGRPGPAPVAAAWVAAGAKGVVDAASMRAGGPPPVRIEIPSIGVSAPVDPLGLNRDGTMQVPADFARAGHYTGGPVPGDVGPAVIVGHVDSRRGPAVFYRLGELRPGAEVIVHRADGSSVAFLVERSKQVPKDAFPTEEVYGPTPGPSLRLITCGGTFDRSSRHYLDNVIVFLAPRS